MSLFVYKFLVMRFFNPFFGDEIIYKKMPQEYIWLHLDVLMMVYCVISYALHARIMRVAMEDCDEKWYNFKSFEFELCNLDLSKFLNANKNPM